MTEFSQHLRAVVRVERGLLGRTPKLRLSVAGILLLPALYTLIYLSSVWDPNAHTRALPVGLVSEDLGITYRGVQVDVGRELLARLRREGEFEYRDYPDADSARAAVRRREVVFALIVPADFSRQAAPGGEAQRGRLIVYTSEGNSYTAAGIARRFAPEVAHRVNETLNEKRWALVLESAAGSARNLQALRDNVERLRDGARQLATGVRQAGAGAAPLGGALSQAASGHARLASSASALADAGTQLADGARRTAAALAQLHARIPPESELRGLRIGVGAQAGAQGAMSESLAQLDAGALKLAEAIAALRTQAQESPFVGEALARAGAELEDGAARLAAGLRQAGGAQERLQAGARLIEGGVQRLTQGVGTFGAAVGALSAAQPEERRADEFAGGLRELARGAHALQAGDRPLAEGASALTAAFARLDEGAARLVAGLELVHGSLPAESPRLDGSASGLAASAESVLEVAAPVPSNGAGLAPNFVPMALWAGALTTGFLFHVRRLPASVAAAGRAARWLGKLAMPALLVLGQSLVMLVTIVPLMQVSPANLPTFALTLAIASLSFLAIVFAMIKLLGDVGKVVAVLLLILQLSSAGALLPIELTNDFFQRISPFLPFTWVVRAFRATMFGAFEGDWLMPWSVVVAAGALATAVGMLAGRWRIVDDAAYGPAIDVD